MPSTPSRCNSHKRPRQRRLSGLAAKVESFSATGRCRCGGPHQHTFDNEVLSDLHHQDLDLLGLTPARRKLGEAQVADRRSRKRIGFQAERQVQAR